MSDPRPTLPAVLLFAVCGCNPSQILMTVVGQDAHPPAFHDDCLGFLAASIPSQSGEYASTLSAWDGARAEALWTEVVSGVYADLTISLDGDLLLPQSEEIDGENMNYLVARSPDGEEVWRLELGPTTGVRFMLVSESGLIYLVVDAHDEGWRGLVIDRDGEQVDTYPIDYEHDLAAAALGADDTLYLVSSEVMAISAQGQELWRLPVEGGMASSVSIGEGVLLVSEPMGLSGIDLDGHRVWGPLEDLTYPTQEVVIDGQGTAYASMQEKLNWSVWLYALDTDTGQIEWTYDHHCSQPSVGDNGKVYAVCGREDSYGVLDWYFTEIDHGEARWELEVDYWMSDPSPGDVQGSPTMCGGHAYWTMGHYQSTLFALDQMPGLDSRSPWPRKGGGNGNRRQVGP